jgi:hypothetical protein
MARIEFGRLDLRRLEIGKDTLQELTESAATHVGRIAEIITGAIRDVAHEVGELATDAFEIREGAARAGSDRAE